MVRIIVFSQNVKYCSFDRFKKLNSQDVNIVVSPHLVFDNEKMVYEEKLGKCLFRTFADYLSDKEMADCDKEAYTGKNGLLYVYQNNIRKIKNRKVIVKVIDEATTFGCISEKYILSNDLGIALEEWKKQGFKYIKCDYYYNNFKDELRRKIKLLRLVTFFAGKVSTKYKLSENDVSVGYYNGKKIVFIGNLNRIGYRLNIKLEHSLEDANKINRHEYDEREKCIYVVTWHEHFKCKLPDDKRYDVRWAQDGYLPSNYSHFDYDIKPQNVTYYCWDSLGTQLFKNRHLPYSIIPFRKKIYIPDPNFSKKVKCVLIAASGSGDWTALKNRSDDDNLVVAFVKTALRFPDIKFIYRCHPTWIHPNHLGVNSINRVRQYFESIGTDNIIVSGNIPDANNDDGFRLSFSRNSLEEDLKQADIVFGEHSIAMIDAAFKGIPFCSVNMTGRRNLFKSINEIGFPHCETVTQIEEIINGYSDSEFQQKYRNAVKEYNKMTDQEL